jgi:hypothetical protein
VTRGAQALGRLADPLLVAIGKDHGRAGLGEGLCRRQANAAARSGDERRFSVERRGHPTVLFESVVNGGCGVVINLPVIRQHIDQN